MTDAKILRFQALQEELRKLEEDPDLKEKLSKVDHLREITSRYGLTDEEAVMMLAPEVVTAGVSTGISFSGINRMPTRTDKKLKARQELLMLRDQIDRQIAKLEDDETVKSRSLLIKDVESLGFSPLHAAELLSPMLFASETRGKKVATKSYTDSPVKPAKPKRPLRYWQNPHTGQIIEGRSMGSSTMQRWIYEYGREVVNDWEISAEEAEDKKK